MIVELFTGRTRLEQGSCGIGNARLEIECFRSKGQVTDMYGAYHVFVYVLMFCTFIEVGINCVQY